MHRLTYESTIRSCFVAYIVQAIVVNFAPLLFVTFQQTFAIGLREITFLITFTFAIQLVIDFASAYLIDRIGYRRCMIAAHVFSAAGLLLISELPFILGNPYPALLISVATYAIGGGLLEVLISPVVEACPTRNKEKAMSMLHSFYCWGFVAVILISTIFFSVFGIQSWRTLARLWAAVPLANMIAFFFVPIYDILPDGRKSGTAALFSNGTFWLLFFMMIASGASEQAVGQWASTFAETGLRACVMMYPLVGCQMVITQFFQSIGKAKVSIFLSLTRQLIYLLPCLLVLPAVWGVNGVWASMPLSDVFAFLTAVGMLLHYQRQWKKKQPAVR